MALQLSVAVRNARNDAIESTIGVSPKLRYYTGAPPASCAAAATGTLLVEMTLPADFMSASSSGVKGQTGVWSGTAGTIAGGPLNAGYFRLMTSDGVTCHAQGTIGLTGSGADMIADNTSINTGQVITNNTFSITDPNG